MKNLFFGLLLLAPLLSFGVVEKTYLGHYEKCVTSQVDKESQEGEGVKTISEKHVLDLTESTYSYKVLTFSDGHCKEKDLNMQMGTLEPYFVKKYKKSEDKLEIDFQNGGPSVILKLDNGRPQIDSL